MGIGLLKYDSHDVGLKEVVRIEGNGCQQPRKRDEIVEGMWFTAVRRVGGLQ